MNVDYLLDVPCEEGARTWREVLTGSGHKSWLVSSDGSDHGLGYNIPGTPYTDSNMYELYCFCKELYKMPVNIIYEDLPKEVLVWEDGIVVEKFENLDFQRLKSIRQAYNYVN